MKRTNKTTMLVQISLIGAVYTVLTLLSGPLAFGTAAGTVQLRIGEALTLLPLFSRHTKDIGNEIGKNKGIS